MNILNSLNKEQQLPVLDTDGAILVTAGAGSGKTRLLTHRIAYLVEEKKVAPYNILAITFTNKAANEMKERVEKMLGSVSSMWISTFHSLCVKILRRDIDRLGYTKSFSIYADDDKAKVLKDIFDKLGIDEEDDKKSIKSHISRAKNNNISPEEYMDEVMFLPRGEDIIEVYKMYEQKLKSSNALDFDDLLIKAYILLRDNKDILEYYQNLFKYIHIDEFQDTNTVQYDIVKLLAGKHKNIMVVGDEDQSIYGWRGANVENISNFQQDFKPVKIYKLEQNYRSTKTIINMANNVIKNNKERIKKKLWTENEVGCDAIIENVATDDQEADFVVKTISSLVRNKGYSCSDFAILMRLNALSRKFESALNNAGLNYKVLGGFKFYERSEVKNIVAYLRILVNPQDEESLLRIINFPKRGIGDTTIQKIKEASHGDSLLNAILTIDSYETLSQGLKNKVRPFANLYIKLLSNIEKPVAEFVSFLIKEAKIKECYDKSIEEEYSKLLNVEQFEQSVCEYQKDNKEASLDEYLQSVMLLTDLDEANMEENSVLVGTIHSVKGLEFRVVFVVGAEEGIFPIIRGLDGEDDIEEERRLMYVAITRAKEMLFLSHANMRVLWNKNQFQKPSRFLKEAQQMVEEKESEPVKQKTYSGKFDEYYENLQKSVIKGQTKSYNDFHKGVQVFHSKFGVGVITDDSELESKHTVTVTFNVLGAKTLSLEYTPLKIMKK